MGVYLALLAWFKLIDVYHTEFSTAGVVVFAYNLFRTLFIFYLFWMLYCAGDFLLHAILRRGVAELGLIDDIGLKFFAGAGVWHIALLVLGYLRLYTVSIAIGITLPFVVISFFDFWAVVQRALRSWRHRQRGGSSLNNVAAWALLGLAVAAALALFVAKGLYPGGGHDYFLHYFAYYRSVIDEGGLWPNQVWYQYYYSKGAGLYFLGFLLTDPLAPQLVSYGFILVAGLIVYRFIEHFSAGPMWPLVGVVLFFGVFIYTPGRGEFMLNGGWGDFEKLHELNAALVIAILWMSAGALDRNSRSTAAWLIGAASAITAAVIINTPISIYLGGVFCLLAAWFLIRGAGSRGLICFALAGVSGAMLCVVLALNYFTSGLIDDQGILYFWPLADVERLYRWGSLALVIMLYKGRAAMAGHSVPLSFQFIWLFLHFLRLYLLYPLFIGGFLVLLIAAIRRSPLRRQFIEIGDDGHGAVLAGGLVIFAIIAYASRDQPISFFRFSSFIVPILVVVGVTLWSVSLENLMPGTPRSAWCAAAPLLVVAAVAAATIKSFGNNNVRAHLANAWRFAVGGFSIDRAYTTQIEAGRYPWGGIYPGARGAYRVLGPRAPIWSFHISAYCMLPDCNMLTYPPFTMGPDWDRVMFGTAEEAKQALQKAGIDYFLFSKELGVLDPLVKSPLFAPDQIGRNLGILWTDGTTVLLTWSGLDTRPLDNSWIEPYRKAAEGAQSVGDLKDIFERLRATPHPWHSFKLPW